MNSDTARDRETYKFYQAAINSLELRFLENASECGFPPHDFVARACKDTALTAFAQLGAVRLDVSRGMISLLDGKYQYILAEATQSLTLLPNMESEPQDELWLGSVIIPRTQGVCEHILTIGDMIAEPISASSNVQALVINDLREDSRFGDRGYVRSDPGARFYAGVPLRSPWGTIIGAYCVFGDEPRDGATQEELLALQGLATTVMKYLEASKAKESHRRYEQMLHGLASFVTGEASIHPYVHRRQLPSDDSAPQKSRQSTDNTEDTPATQLERDQRPKKKKRPRLASTSYPSARKRSTMNLQESMLPPGARTMFARAANIMRESIDVCGCIIFDASVATFGGAIDAPHRRKSAESQVESSSNASSDTSSSYMSESDQPSPSGEPWGIGEPFPSPESDRVMEKKMCDVLGFSYRNSPSITGEESDVCCAELAESDLKRLLRKYPSGHVFNLSSPGGTSPSQVPGNPPKTALGTEATGCGTAHLHTADMSPTGKSSIMIQKLLKVAPGARSIAILPLWDYQRDRWFAGCLCWSTEPKRALYPDVDLIYLQAFGNSIMMELSRLDAITSDRAKTAFVASISHELRCPLHGILGGVQLLQGTRIDAYQASMLDSVTVCGKTLLDTVDHVLDFAKVNAFSRLPLTKPKDGQVRLVGSQGGQDPNEPASLSADVDLATLIEEVVETVFVGQAHRGALFRLEQMVDQNVVQPRMDSAERDPNKAVCVILDIPHHTNWMVATQPGAWRRIVMNLFGNALKYTASGYVRVSMRVDPKQDSKNGEVTLVVTDSGKGISKEFLSGGLWRPFSQEDSFAPGTGLGLSIVHQILQGLGGRIELKSEVGVGTEVRVNLSLPIADNRPSPDDEDRFLHLAAAQLKDRKVCILDTTDPDGLDDLPPVVKKGRRELGLALSRTLKNWFGADAEVSNVSTALSAADVIMCLEPRIAFLGALQSVDVRERSPLVVFVARDPREVARLRDDPCIRGGERAVEIITQPCGPGKLAKSLSQALERREQRASPLASPTPEATSPDREWATPKWIPTHPANASPLTRTRSPSTIDPDPIPHSLLDKHVFNRSTQASPTENRLRVLLVDDNRINLTLLTAFMRKHRHDYEEATNGLEAVEAYRHTTGRFDFVLMDLTMPVMDGMAATREIRRHEQREGIKPSTIIALTGLASATARIEALNSGINYFLTKPVKFQSLHRILKGEPVEGGLGSREGERKERGGGRD